MLEARELPTFDIPILNPAISVSSYLKEQVGHGYEFVALCERILTNNAFAFALLNKNKGFVEDAREGLIELEKELGCALEVAQYRIKNEPSLRAFNENVFYSSLALKALLSSLLYGGLGGIEGVSDIVEFGRGIARAQRELDGRL